MSETMKIALFPGDGIGPEILAAVDHVLREAEAIFGIRLERRTEIVGLEALTATGTTIPDKVWETVDWADGIVLAPLSTYAYPPIKEGGRNLSSELRLSLELSANIRPSVSLPGSARPFDLVICRENTEGFYAVRAMHKGSGEFMPDSDTAFAIRKITRAATRRVAETAFTLSQKRRRKVTVVHKQNVLKLSDGLFLDEVRRVSELFPDVELDEILVDAAAAVLVRCPERFDVMLTTNLFGDILSNQAAELAGGLGIGPSLNAGKNKAVAQAAHGSAPEIAGQGIANPTALILSTAMLLDWQGRQSGELGLVDTAQAISAAVEEALKHPASRTPDLGGPLGTMAFAKVVADALPNHSTKVA